MERACNLLQGDSRRLCEVCGSDPWKYRCPGCGRRSCSLPCVKQHKLEHGCDGKRRKTAFVPLLEFDDNQLLSDYYFLEDVGRFVDSAHRDHICHNLREGSRSKLHWVRSVAERRGTAVLLQPPGMSLHTINTSRTVWRGQKRRWTIHWRVHLVFPQSGAEFQEDRFTPPPFFDRFHRIPEDTMLRDLLNRYIHPSKSDPIARHRLQRYVSGGVDSMEVFLAEGLQTTEPRYDRLEIDKSLCDNLRRKTVVEFPTLHVVLREESNTQATTPQAAGNTSCSDDPPNVSTPLSTLCWGGGRPREEERGGRRPRGEERDGGRRGGEEVGQGLEGEELSEGEIQSGPDTPPPIPSVKNSLQMIADMYTDD